MGNMGIKLRSKICGWLLAIAVVLTVSQPGVAQDVFAALADMNQVECTYISGRFAHNKKFWQSRTGKHSVNLSKGFSSLYSYQCFSIEAVDKARKILKDYLKKNPDMEIVMRSKQAGQEYAVYEKFIDDGSKVTQMIIWSQEDKQVCEIVVINWKNGLSRDMAYYTDDAERRER